MKKAVALLSGGLDSTLAIKLIKDQGIDVTAVAFVTPFFGSDRAEKAAKMLDVPLEIIDITAEHLEIVKKPRYGYGKNMNPCIDCHSLMVKKAGEFANKIGADFIITGEVLGERPMSQNQQSLKIVEKQSGMEGYVLRPLSAKLLDITIPEEKGWVDREKLLNIKGKSRKPQMALATNFGIADYPTPAGGCLLTESGFSRRLKALLEILPDPAPSDLFLLRYGRHFIFGQARLIVARTEKENEQIVQLVVLNDIVLKVKDFPGPRGLLRGGSNEELIYQAAVVTARFSKAREKSTVSIAYRQDDASEKIIKVKSPLRTYEDLELGRFMI